MRFGQQRGRVTDEAGNALRDRVADLAHVQVWVIDLRSLADKVLFDRARLLERLGGSVKSQHISIVTCFRAPPRALSTGRGRPESTNGQLPLT